MFSIWGYSQWSSGYQDNVSMKQSYCICQKNTREWTLTTFDLAFHLLKSCTRHCPSLLNKWREKKLLFANKTIAKDVAIGV